MSDLDEHPEGEKPSTEEGDPGTPEMDSVGESDPGEPGMDYVPFSERGGSEDITEIELEDDE